MVKDKEVKEQTMQIMDLIAHVDVLNLQVTDLTKYKTSIETDLERLIENNTTKS